MSDFRLSVRKGYYQQLFDTCQLRASWKPRIENAIAAILSHRSQYASVESITSVPWWFVGVLHYRESTCNFNTHLHNGDPLSRRTVHEPPGRPLTAPRNGNTYTWEESAVDALTWKTFDKVKDASIAAWLWRLEIWNGFGYAMRGLNSEYLWNGSNHFGSPPHCGKFVADGRFDSSARSEQVGAGVLLWAMHHKGLLVSQNANTQSFSTEQNTRSPGALRLVNAFRYYQKLPHQDAAIELLDKGIPDELREQFTLAWRQVDLAAIVVPKKTEPRFVFNMPLGDRPPANMVVGKLKLYGFGDEPEFDCTSGQRAYQYSGGTKMKGKGPLPGCKAVGIPHYWVHTKAKPQPNTKGIEGNSYVITPDPVVISGVSRGEFLIHNDSNRGYAPGSSGCIVAMSEAIWGDIQKLMADLRAAGYEKLPLEVIH